MINLPSNILTSYNYEKIIKSCLKEFSPKITSYKDKQLEKNFPLINVVGRSSENKPILIDIEWSKNKKNNFPNITLIGKGVTFDMVPSVKYCWARETNPVKRARDTLLTHHT